MDSNPRYITPFSDIRFIEAKVNLDISQSVRMYTTNNIHISVIKPAIHHR